MFLLTVAARVGLRIGEMISDRGSSPSSQTQNWQRLCEILPDPTAQLQVSMQVHHTPRRAVLCARSLNVPASPARVSNEQPSERLANASGMDAELEFH